MLAVVLQHVVNGLVAGTQIALPAIGLTLIYGVLRFANFSIGAHVSIGAFAGLAVHTTMKAPLPVLAAVAFVAAGAIGVATDRIALAPLRRRTGPETALTVAVVSIALNLALESMLRFAFGNDLRGYDMPIARDFAVAGIRLGPQQIANAGAAAVVVVLLFLLLHATRLGRAMRAAADNPPLAALKGIDAGRIARLATFIGMGLAGVGGVLIGLDTSVDPLTGFRIVLTVFAAAVVGGLGSVGGALLGALAVGLAEDLALLALPPAYRGAVGFVAILLVLWLRPQGIVGWRRA